MTIVWGTIRCPEREREIERERGEREREGGRRERERNSYIYRPLHCTFPYLVRIPNSFYLLTVPSEKSMEIEGCLMFCNVIC